MHHRFHLDTVELLAVCVIFAVLSSGIQVRVIDAVPAQPSILQKSQPIWNFQLWGIATRHCAAYWVDSVRESKRMVACRSRQQLVTRL
jgi:hypothetical protein